MLGGPSKAAAALGVPRYQTVQQWIASGSVPPKYCPPIERETGGRIRCEDLRPDVDWGYLRGTGTAGEPPRSSPIPLSASTQGANSESSIGAAVSTAAPDKSAAPALGGGRKTGIADPVTEAARCA